MVSSRFGFSLRSRLITLLVAIAASNAFCGCGGNSGNGAPASSLAVSSVPRSADGLLFTASADHATYASKDLITLTYSITNPTGDEPTVSTFGGGWFFADATNASQTIHLISGADTSPTAGAEPNIFRLYVDETVSTPQPTHALLPPGVWHVTCWLVGSIGGVSDGMQPPYAYATNPVAITVLR